MSINFIGMVLVCILGYSLCLQIIYQLATAFEEYRSEYNHEQNITKAMYQAVLTNNRKAFNKVYSRYLQYHLSKM